MLREVGSSGSECLTRVNTVLHCIPLSDQKTLVSGFDSAERRMDVGI